MRRLVLSLGLVLALGGAALAQSSSPDPAASPTPAPAVVHLKNFAFVPETVTIRPGQSVRFVQDDDTPHTVTAVDKSFDSGNLNQKDTWRHTFATEGTYKFICAYHPYMKGTVIVK